MKKSFLSVAAAALMFAACNEPLNEAAEVEDNSQELSQSDTDGETILGKEIENPYSLTYMRQASDITTYDSFKQKLIDCYGNKDIIEKCFSTYGF